ncbi:MAG TPA: ABC transporter substrate-binding protein [Phycisphaerales bacterium]|nr:ABC transporter substrate-binding protein [Phycisphaerales bacterium]
MSKAADISRRAVLGAMGAAAAGFVAFGPRGAGDERAKGRTVVDYWEKWTGHEGRAMQQAVDEFNSGQREVFVRYFVTGNIGQKALIAIAGGTPPDLIGLWNFNVPAYAQSGAILRLDDLAAAEGMRLDQYRRGVQEVMTVGRGSERKWYGVVNTAGTLGMFYNKRQFREAGLDPERPPRTIEELEAAHARLTKRDGQGGIVQTGFLHGEPGWWSWLWGYHFGAGIYDEEADRATIDRPEHAAAYAWLQRTVRGFGRNDKEAADALQLFRDGFGNYNTPQNAFLAGKVAMELQGPWLANMVEEFAPDLDYGVAPMPCAAAAYDAANPVALVDTDVLCIPRGAKNPQAAMKFIAFTQRQEITERLALAHCKICPLLKASEGFIKAHRNRGLAVHNALADSARAFVVPKTRAWPEIKDDFDARVRDMMKLELGVEDALTGLQRRSQASIDLRRAERLRRYGA